MQAIYDAQEDMLAEVISVMLPADSASRARKLAKIVALTANGRHWKEVSALVGGLDGVPWVEISGPCLQCPPFSRLWREAQRSGEDARRALRDAEAHDRATIGWDEPVRFQGILVGTVKRFDSALLQMLHKEDHPEFYPVTATGTQVNVQVNALMAALAGTGPASLIEEREAAKAAQNAQDAPGRAGQ